MLVFIGEVLKVESTPNPETNKSFNVITFRSEVYDRDLEQNVPAAKKVIITDECMNFFHNYKSHVGDTISVAVSVSKSGWLLTQSDVLDPSALLTV